jgi:integrase
MPRAAANRRSLTKELVSRIKPRPSKFFVWDDQTPNLAVAVYPGGAKSYVIRVTFEKDGKPCQRMETLGHIADFETPEAARKAALALRQEYKAGIDVRAEKEATKVRDAALETTLAQSLERYITARSTGTRPMKDTTSADMRKVMAYGLKQYIDRPLVELTPEVVIDWHRQRKLESPARADLEARYLRAVWNWTKEELPILQLPEWPTGRWVRQKEWSPPVRRTRRLTRDTTHKWMETTLAWPKQRDRVLFLLLFYTGWRISEAISLKWSAVDLARARATLHDTKTRQDLELPLARQAIAALRELPLEAEWVFPAPLKEGTLGAMVPPSKAIQRHKITCGIEWSPHDLRRGFITLGESIGVPTAAVRRLTGHVINLRDAHDGYVHFDTDDLAPHVQRIADALEAMAALNPETHT